MNAPSPAIYARLVTENHMLDVAMQMLIVAVNALVATATAEPAALKES